MPSTHTGHFVQVWRPIVNHGYPIEYIEVEGRSVAKQVRPDHHYYWETPGWNFVSRELTKRRAIFYAKAYRNAGIRSRVWFRGNGGETRVVAEYEVR